MKTLKSIEIIFASTVATLMLSSGAAAQQHFSRYEDRLADRTEAVQGAPTAERAPAVSWYERKTGQSSGTGASTTVPSITRFHERAPKNCGATLARHPQRPWCG